MQNAELNPLLNPLLADNMGKWAEVYFKNPPEKRDQAVLDLLRQLEAQKVDRQKAGGASTQDEDEIVHCQRCGRDNPLTHKFCGMCGAILWGADPTREESPSTSGDRRQPAEAGRDEAAERLFSAYEPASTNSLSLFRSIAQQDYDDEEWDEARPAHPYRFYIGAVLLVVLVFLGYTAWRSARSSQNPDEPSAAPPIAKEASPEPSAPAAQPAPEAKKTQQKTASTAPETAAGSEKAQPNANVSATQAHAEQAPPAPAALPRSPSGNANGSDDLATAMSYLYGKSGQGQDKSEAAKWLWRAIAKHNGPATLVLADLYLKGDGVPKNCDQARVLLDSAARKGISGAGERLRNLQAFGCQ